MLAVPDSGIAKAIEAELDVPDPEISKALEILYDSNIRTDTDNS